MRHFSSNWNIFFLQVGCNWTRTRPLTNCNGRGQDKTPTNFDLIRFHRQIFTKVKQKQAGWQVKVGTFSISLSEIIILLIRTPNEPLIIILIIDKQKMLSHKDLTHARYSRVNPLLGPETIIFFLLFQWSSSIRF